MKKNEEPLNDRVTFYDDGKYRWKYEMDLFKNPTVFFLVWKILFIISVGIFAIIFLTDIGKKTEIFLIDLKFFGIFLGGMTFLVLLGYLLYAAMMGGKYIVEFEMDEKGVNHKQTPKQAKKAKKLAKATALAGVGVGRFSAIGTGMSAARTEMYSDFNSVRKVKAYPRRNLIKVNGVFSRNQVYAQKEDILFVRDYIISHCPKYNSER